MSCRKSVTAASEARRICEFYRKVRKLKKGSVAARRYMSACTLKLAKRNAPKCGTKRRKRSR